MVLCVHVGGGGDVCMYSEECSAFFGLFEYFDQGSSFRLLFLRVDCECYRSSRRAKVFQGASVFDGDLSEWDVATVTEMYESKSIRIVIGGFRRGFGVGVDDVI